MTDKIIETSADADAIRADVEAVHDGWFADQGRIDWESFLDRLEARGYDLGASMQSEAVKRIKSIVRELRRH